VWLPAWLADPSSVVEKLVAAVDAARLEPAPVVPIQLPTAAIESFKGVAALRASVTASLPVPPAAAAPKPKPAPAPKHAGPAVLDGETAFTAWTPKTAGEKTVLDELPAAKSARVVRRVLANGIKAEGPIHVDRLVRLTAAAFGLNRVTEARKTAILSVLPPSALADEWLWPEGSDRAGYDVFRRQASSTERPLEHVPPEEIGNAMTALCRAAAGMEREELLTQAAAVFGYKRRTPTVTPVLEAAVDAALAAGRLTTAESDLLVAS